MKSILRYKPNGIPILSQNEIDIYTENIVKELMPELYSRQIDAVNLKTIFSSMKGWHYAGRYLSEDGSLLGLASFRSGEILITDEKRNSSGLLHIEKHTILVDRALYHPRLEHTFRFTFAHEAGHAMLHERFCSDPDNMKKYSEQEKEWIIRDTKEEFKNGNRLNTDRDWVEWQANAFASSILMPKELVMRVADLVGRNEDLETLNQLMVTISDIFKVSLTAAFYRMKGLGLIGEKFGFVNGIINTF